MPSILLRFGKRRASWSPSTPLEQLLQAEFRSRDGITDLRPSVYEIPGAQSAVVRTHAEHTAGNDLKPTNGFMNFDLSGWSAVESSDGECCFKFAREAHRELIFDDEAALARFVGRVMKDRQGREFATTREDLVKYARSWIAAHDDEWLAFCSQCSASQVNVWGCPKPPS
jgi:hypothetical protein